MNETFQFNYKQNLNMVTIFFKGFFQNLNNRNEVNFIFKLENSYK